MRYRPLSLRRPGLRFSPAGGRRGPAHVVSASMVSETQLAIVFDLPVAGYTTNGFSVTVDGVPNGIVGDENSVPAVITLTLADPTTPLSAILLSNSIAGSVALGEFGDTPLEVFSDFPVTPYSGP